MAKADVIKQPYSRLLNRPRSSEIDHIMRIRTATSSRQIRPLWNDISHEDYSKYLSPEKSDETISSMSRLEYADHKSCIPEESPEDFNHNKFKHRDSKGFHSTSGEKNSTRRPLKRLESDASEQNSQKKVHKSRKTTRRPTYSENTDGSRKNSTSEQLLEDSDTSASEYTDLRCPLDNSVRKNSMKSKELESNVEKENLKEEGDKSRKVIRRQTYSTTHKGVRKKSPLSTNIGRSSKKDSSSRKQGAKVKSGLRKKQRQPVKSKKKLSEDSKKSSNQTLKDADRHKNLQDDQSDNNARDISQGENKLDPDNDSKQMPTVVDNFFDLDGPLSVKDIIVLKWLQDIKCPESYKQGTEENKSEFLGSKQFLIRVFRKPLVSNSNRNNNRYSKPILESSYGSSRHPPEKYFDMKSVSEENKNTSEGRSTETFDAEMYLTDLGKLKITIDTKPLTPEDAAVIVWLDDLPAPDYRKRLSLSLSAPTQRQLLEGSKRQSVPPIEGIPSLNTNAVFPSVTILKNLAVDSKTRQKNLSEDSSSSVFYKRCNLSHTKR